jgi:hypothetical protein
MRVGRSYISDRAWHWPRASPNGETAEALSPLCRERGREGGIPPLLNLETALAREHVGYSTVCVLVA